MKDPGKIRFGPNGGLRILQASDAQDLKRARKAMLYALDAAYDKLDPDLVIFTGDNILGNHLLDARFGTRRIASGKAATLKAAREAIYNICAPLEKRKIPFAVIFGNHDDMNLLTKNELADIYGEYSMRLPMYSADGGAGCGTYNVPVFPSSGEKPVFNLWLLDSARYDKEKDECFEETEPRTVEWYKKTSELLASQNGGKPLPSLMFLHIPLPEILNLVEKCAPNDPGAARDEKGGFFRLKPGRASGTLKEYPSVLTNSAGLFDALLERGDVKGIVSGHDHNNCFRGKYKGIEFIQTPCVSFRCYGGKNRGVRIFDFDEAAPSDYISYFLNYADLCGNGAGARLRYFWDADENEKLKAALIASAAGALTVGAASVFNVIKRNKKNKRA